MIGWASLPLRFGLGVIFIAHGGEKLFGLFNSVEIVGFTDLFFKSGISSGVFLGYAIAYTEFLGGICLLLGIFTTISAAIMFLYIVAITYKFNISKGFFLSGGGYEYNLLIMCACITLMLLGGGNISLTDKF